MKKFLLCQLMLLTGISTMAKAPCADSANIYTFTHNGHTYELVKENRAWTEAAACAVSRGGYLAEINDLAEQTAVYNAIQASGVNSNYKPVMDGGGASYVWIGGTDSKTEGQWAWDGKGNNTGTTFWSGQGAAGNGGGAAVAGSFVNWGGKSTGTIQEPDDYANMQDAAAMALSAWPYGVAGEWNDINSSNSIYYIIEYASTTGLNNSIPSSPFIHIYPVPATDAVYIENNHTEQALNFMLVSAEGKEVANGMLLEKTSLPTAHLAAGLYFLYLPAFPQSCYKIQVIKN